MEITLEPSGELLASDVGGFPHSGIRSAGSSEGRLVPGLFRDHVKVVEGAGRNASTTESFSVVRSHATKEAAGDFWLDEPDRVRGLHTVRYDVGGSLKERVSLVSLTSNSLHGLLTRHTYQIAGGELVTVADTDTDANAAIAAISSAGGTLSEPQQAAIDTWVVAGKAAGWWQLHHRIFLPVHGVAAANAIDLVNPATSGTFNGGVTHGAGFVNGDGSTGWFNPSSTPSTNGMTASEGALTFASPNQYGSGVRIAMGSAAGLSGTTSLVFASGTLYFHFCYQSASQGSVNTSGVTDTQGLLIGNRHGTDLGVYQRQGGVSSTMVATTNSSTSSISSEPFALMANSSGGVRSSYTTRKFSFWAIAHTGMDATQRESFLSETETLLGNWTGAL